MLLKLLVVSCTLGLSAAVCPKNQTDNTCLSSDGSSCMSQCMVRGFNETCLALPGCRWDGLCRPTNATLEEVCTSKATSTDCGAVADCYWRTQTCATMPKCGSTDPANPFCWGTDAANCAAQGAHCKMGKTCSTNLACAPLTTESSCTATAGCFWLETSETFQTYTERKAECVDCFLEPGASLFPTYRELVGKTCTQSFSGFTASTSWLRAVPAASGCGAALMQIPKDWIVEGATCTDTANTATAAARLNVASCFAVAFAAFFLLAF